MKKLGIEFYRNADVLKISKELLGKILETNFDGIITSGRIVECEAYAGVHDKAAHSFGSRRTTRTEVMFADGGVAYVYLCYGIHHLFNVVTNRTNVPQAILIRSLVPINGIPDMLLRTNKKKFDYTLTRGPGNVSKALGIRTSHTGANLNGKEIYILDDGFKYKPSDIVTSPRIGVDYAGEDAALPYRFFVKGNSFVSGKTQFSN